MALLFNERVSESEWKSPLESVFKQDENLLIAPLADGALSVKILTQKHAQNFTIKLNKVKQNVFAIKTRRS